MPRASRGLLASFAALTVAVTAIALCGATLLVVVTTRHVLQLHAPESAMIVRCDANRISQVLNNLHSNAIKYSPDDGRVDVSIALEGDAAVVEVCDEGIGISKEEQSQLFAPFRRTSRARSFFPGVGLGLYAVRRIVEAHGGSIAIESVEDRGSTFIVRLPVTGPQTHAPEATTAPEPQTAERIRGTPSFPHGRPA